MRTTHRGGTFEHGVPQLRGVRRQIAPVGTAGRRGEERNALEMHVPRRVDAKFKRCIEQAFAARLHFHPTLLTNGFFDSATTGLIVGKSPHSAPAAAPRLFDHGASVHRRRSGFGRRRRGAEHRTGLDHSRQVVGGQTLRPSHPHLATAHAAQRTEPLVVGQETFGRAESAQQSDQMPIPSPRFDALHRGPIGNFHPFRAARFGQMQAHITGRRPQSGQFGQRVSQSACRA